MGGRADQLLAQRLRPTPSLHRTPPGLRRRLPRPGRRHRHHPCTAAGRMVLLPLGHPAKITAHPLTYWRTLLACRLTPDLLVAAAVAVSFDGLADVVAGSAVPISHSRWSSRPGVAGFRRAGRRAGRHP